MTQSRLMPHMSANAGPSLDKNAADFLDAMQESEDLLCRFVLRRLKQGSDPRAIAQEMVEEAEHARLWCIGRYGSDRL